MTSDSLTVWILHIGYFGTLLHPSLSLLLLGSFPHL